MAETTRSASAGAAVKDDLSRDEVVRLSAALGERLDQLGRRLEAAEVYNAGTLPDRVGHLWRYTDPATLLPTGELLPEVPPTTDDGPGIRLSPGRVSLAAPALGAGVRILPLAEARESRSLLGTLVGPGFGPFEALNAAIWSSGALIDVPAGARLGEPIRVTLDASAVTSAFRLLIVLGAGAEATIVEDHGGGALGGRVYSVTEGFVGDGARLDHVLIQRWERQTAGHQTTRFDLGAGAALRAVTASFGGATVKADVGAILAGEGAQSEILGLAFGDGRQRMDHHTVHEHRARHGWSNIDFRAALGGRGRSSYTGLIRIEQDAQHSEAYQESRNLLLSDRAHADAIPELEILNSEVRCTHGATTAPIDEELVFFLMSRGIPRSKATSIIVGGFIEQTLARVPGTIRDELAPAIERRLAALTEGRS